MANVKKQQNKNKIIGLSTAAVLMTLLMSFFLFNYISALRTDNSQKNLATEIAYVGQGLLRSSSTVLDKYNEESYRQLMEGRNKLNLSIDILSKGGVLSNGVEVPPPNEYLSDQIIAFQSVVSDMTVNINYILNEKNDVFILRDKKDKYEKINRKILENLSVLAQNASDYNITGASQTKYLSSIGAIYNQLSSPSVRYYADDKNVLNEDYIAEQNNALQIISQQTNEIMRLTEIVKDFNISSDKKSNLNSEMNKLYLSAQEMKQEASSIMEILPKVVAAKKYASQADKLSVRLDDAYTSLAFSLSTTHNNSSIWLISFVICAAILFIVVVYIVNLASNNSNVIENMKGENKIRSLVKEVNEYLKSFFVDGKIKKNITIQSNGHSASDKIINSMPYIKQLALTLNSDRKEFNSLMREFDYNTSNMIENLESVISFDNEFNKKVDGVLPSIDDVRSIINDMNQLSKEINIDNTQTNIEHSNERINDTISGFNRLKETMQESNKSIKYVSENSQNINENIEEIKRHADKMLINALNTDVTTDLIMSKIVDPDMIEMFSNINSYIKNIREIANGIISYVEKIDLLNSSTMGNTTRSIQSLEQNIEGIVLGGESIIKIQSSLQSINTDLKYISQKNAIISSKAVETVNKIEVVSKEFKETKNDNRESMEDKNKILLKLKSLHEKINEKIDKD